MDKSLSLELSDRPGARRELGFSRRLYLQSQRHQAWSMKSRARASAAWRPAFPPNTSSITHMTNNQPSSYIPATKTDEASRTADLNTGNLIKFTLFKLLLTSPPRAGAAPHADPSAGYPHPPPPPAATSQHSSRAVQLLRSSSAGSRSVHIMQNVSRRAACKTAKQHQSESREKKQTEDGEILRPSCTRFSKVSTFLFG